MIDPVVTTMIAAGGSIATAIAMYYRMRGPTKNGKAVLEQRVDTVEGDIKELKADVKEVHGTVTDIGRSTARIEGLLEGWEK
jgi:hypothetical protein